jgi:hypothetical protein
MTFSLPITKNYFESTKVIEQKERELEQFCRDLYNDLPIQEKIALDHNCDKVIHKLKERSRMVVISREQIRYAAICTLYYCAFGESPLMTAVNAKEEG